MLLLLRAVREKDKKNPKKMASMLSIVSRTTNRLHKRNAASLIRHLSNAGSQDQSSPTSITTDEAIAVLDAVLAIVKHGVPGKRLAELHGSDGNIQQKWQSMIEIRLQTELHVINAFGFESNQHGMFAYRQVMSRLMQTSSPTSLEELQSRDKLIWGELINKGFNISPAPIEIGQARQIVFMVTSELQQNSCIQELQNALDKAGSPDDAQKNLILQQHLLSVWQKILPNYGYDGDDGYVRFQSALVDHSGDSQISTMIQSALMTVTNKVGFTK